MSDTLTWSFLPLAPADSHESFASGSTNECIPVESGNLTMAYK